MSDKKRIIVLGGGYGGILTAKKLARKFKKNEEVEITLIDKKPYHAMLTELHEVAAGRVPEDAIRIDLKKIFAGRNVNVIMDEIIDIDFNGKVLKSDDTSYAYDYLVMAAGSKPTFFGVAGAKENAFQLWTYDDAVEIHAHIMKTFHEAVKEKNIEKRKKMLTFVVVGCGFTGVEMVGELAEWKDRLCKDFYVDPEEVKIYAVDSLPKVLPIFPDNLSKKAEKVLVKLGVEIITGSPITEVGKDFVQLGDKGRLEAGTVIWAAGVEGADVMANLEVKREGRNRIVTNDKLQSVDHENVYVVGDNIFFIPEGEQRPVPQMVENAEHSAATVAHNIVSEIKGGEMEVYKPEFHGAMVCIGGRTGVAHLGMPGKFFGLSGFFAMFVKHFINLVYFIQVAGFNKCWTYLMHEIFHIKDNRSLVGGHFAKASPNFWLVPLRLFVGWKWFEQGWHKLPGVLADPSNIFLIPAKVVDGATSASAAEWAANNGGGEAVAEAVAALPVPGFIASMVEWSMDAFFYTAEGGFTTLATVFQTGMVLGEVLFGLALMAGLFTAVSAIATIAMGGMIWASGMAPLEMLWYMAGGVALIGGSGSTFGMDYYVLPFLKKFWKKIGFVKKYYLYTE
ncbi:FAD-dependent oxidoreductase [Acidaminobacter hydrogenoformans]|uniref:NADH:ubiquinone reductase (non-electrogenic) n=1 Tax=Acidaminobacter hydrogenoformans DSM 2784 TaxID=1120920 RepID=A0A1G5RSP5_9FIRM|nr:FAD-dependent oxidoreductase [Acidaminobacter hydrogenoformans]SCZ76319.1 NADH dehydrogenase [Acidaminobacter hydrogenoformans DSM 2784]